MSKEAVQQLTKYQADLKARLDSKELPKKHLNREASYRQFLTFELKAVTKKIEELKMVGGK